MPTILGGDYKPLDVVDLDVVGYLGQQEGFVILVPAKLASRQLPDGFATNPFPCCLHCNMTNNEQINFHGVLATLHDVNGDWFYMEVGKHELEVLQPSTFFEIGHRD